MHLRTRVSYYLPLCLLAAACNDPSPAGDAVESVTSPLVHSTSGKLMPFGGQDGTCVAVVGNRLQVATCGNANQTFNIVGDQLQTQNGLCVDIQFGDLAAGIVGVTTCNGTINQKWIFADGKIISKNQPPPPPIGQSYCLDVRFGNHALGSELGVAPCNGTPAQAFWMAGYTFDLKSSFLVSTGPGTCSYECLDVLFDVEQAGTGLDNFNCNGTNAQWFVFDTSHRIQLANNTGLCVGLNGPVQNGLAPVALKTCNVNDATQRWFYSGTTGTGSIRNMSANVCLDVQGGSSTPSTPVVAFTCNGTAAQKWNPQLDIPVCFVIP